MMDAPITDWDDAYANSAYIPGSADLPDVWAARAQAFRDSDIRIDCDVPYGPAPRARFDLVWPKGPPKGLFVFVHGGYWLQSDKSSWTHLAAGAQAAGWAVCLPSYTLAPEARIGQITAQIVQAVTQAAGRVAGPIRLAGHSAGGHLAARMMCQTGGLPAALLDRLAHVVSISGVHDLRPLLQTKMNATLQLDAAQAQAESPALLSPVADVPLTCWVGAQERPEFLRQAHLLANIWRGLGEATICTVDAGHDHFSVVDGLAHADSPLCRAILAPRDVLCSG
jgi:acetyl esterase/lipase